MTHLRTQLDANIRAFFAHIPAVRDGDAGSIHDARVAIRRIQAGLPVLSAWRPDVDVRAAEDAARCLGRALGRARDVDVALELCRTTEDAAPHLIVPTAALKRDLQSAQLKSRRRLVKKIDAARLASFNRLIEHILPGEPWLGQARRYPRVLSALVAEQAVAVRASIEHGSGVYFPRRSHATRIQIKRLRYLFELAPETASTARHMKLLKRAQEALGSLHDREFLRARISRLRQADSAQVGDFSSLISYLDTECRGLFEKYLELRPRVIQLCESVGRPSQGRPWGGRAAGSALGLAVAVLPVAMTWLGNRRRAAVPMKAAAAAGDLRWPVAPRAHTAHEMLTR